MTTDNNTLHQIFDDIEAACLWQEKLTGIVQSRTSVSTNGVSNAEKLCLLGDKLGAVARAVMDQGKLVGDQPVEDLREELIQCAAVCVAWCQALDGEGK